MLVHEGLTKLIIGAAIRVHRALGPGLLESAYETCVAHALSIQGLRIERQMIIGIEYEGMQLDAGYRADLVVEDHIVVELKAVDRLEPIHEAQLMTYLRLSNKPVGLLINFNVVRLRDGIVRRAMTASPRQQVPISAALRGPPR